MKNFASEYTVLIVDDVPANVMFVQVILKKEGYSLLAADNGREALQLARERRPNIILLDVMMPGMDGYEVLQQLKTDPDTNHIPVIIMSELNDMSSILKGYQFGAMEYVTKPFRREELIKRIAQRFELYTIERYKQELEATMESRDTLYSIISHDLRTPLGSLKMMNHSILKMIDKDAITEATYEMLLTMNKTSEETFLLLDNLTKWNKFTQNKILPYKQKTEIKSLLENIISVYDPIVELKQATISLQAAEPELSGMVDIDMLKTILRNLLSDAIKYSRPGSVIHISTRRNRDSMIFCIKHPGSGKAHTTELGLLLSKAFIELHGGKLEVESDETKGSTYRFSIRVES
ncbi:MAG: hybrid sensor histidine kinase/response regulator [Tannerellaceae bacterium]|jgi:two-component system sensor histidine kinase/response regulator|nr:hybrid sensor histidine kinase/response regulator [Tannerellaceae bacterium]